MTREQVKSKRKFLAVPETFACAPCVTVGRIVPGCKGEAEMGAQRRGEK